MQRLSHLALALAAACATVPSHATVSDARFAGIVASQTGTTSAVGAAVDGEFLFDSVTASFLAFRIGNQRVAPGYASTAAVTPDGYTAFYRAQLSPVQQGGTLNSTFVLDFEALNEPWAADGAIALLFNPDQVAANLDTGSSFFSFYTANADGTNVQSLTATLETLTVGAVPEPASVALFGAGLALLAARRLKREM